MNSDLKRFIPEPLVTVTRPLRLYFHPQRRFDRRFQVDTAGVIEPNLLGLRERDVGDASSYQPTNPDAFFRVMQRIPLDYERYIFVDLGSGKGAALLYASAFPFQRIVGVEFSPQLHLIAERNVASYRSRARMCCRDIVTLRMDAAAYPLPPEPTVLYLYNPFRGRVLETVVARLRDSLAVCPRDVIVIYTHQLARHAVWDQADFLQAVRREPDCSIYRSFSAFPAL